MNAASKVLEQAYLSTDNLWVLLFGRQSIGFISLLIFVIASAFSLIYVKDLNRRLTSDVQSQQMVREAIFVKRNKLLLERSTWATPVRVEHIATQKLKMQAPTAKQVVIVHLDQ